MRDSEAKRYAVVAFDPQGKAYVIAYRSVASEAEHARVAHDRTTDLAPARVVAGERVGFVNVGNYVPEELARGL